MDKFIDVHMKSQFIDMQKLLHYEINVTLH